MSRSCQWLRFFFSSLIIVSFLWTLGFWWFSYSEKLGKGGTSWSWLPYVWLNLVWKTVGGAWLCWVFCGPPEQSIDEYYSDNPAWRSSLWGCIDSSFSWICPAWCFSIAWGSFRFEITFGFPNVNTCPSNSQIISSLPGVQHTHNLCFGIISNAFRRCTIWCIFLLPSIMGSVLPSGYEYVYLRIYKYSYVWHLYLYLVHQEFIFMSTSSPLP